MDADSDLFRLVAGCVLVPVLFWLAGSIAVLFAGMVCLFEGLRKTPKWYISLIGVAEDTIGCWNGLFLFDG